MATIYYDTDADPKALAGKTIAVDPERSVAAIIEALAKPTAHAISKRDPAILP